MSKDNRTRPDKERAVIEFWLSNPDESFRSIGERFGTSHSQVGRWIRKATKSQKVQFLDKKEMPDDVTTDELFYAFIKFNDSIMAGDRKQTKATVRLDEDKPIGIAFTGDWHLGALGADYPLFKKHMDMIEETEGLYAIGLGDYKDNANSYIHKDSVTEVLTSPKTQERFVKHFIRQISPIAIVRGCHDHWDHKTGNRDFIQELCDEVREVNGKGAINLWHGGSITILLGDEEYKVRCRHKYKNESGLNVINSLRRMEDAFGFADVQAVAHKHDPYLFEYESKGGNVIWLRCGSYKRYDEYGQQLAGYRGKEAVPVVILWPDRHKILGFRKIEDGIEHLKMLREKVVV